MRQPVGSLEVIALLDACGPFFQTQGAGFPAATPADWDLARRIDPSAFGPGGTWNLSFWCFAIRGPGDRIVLADAGVGPAGSPASAWAPVPGRLPDELLGAGIDPRDVDAVILTHLHADHVGWSVQPDGTPTFPNARYLIQQREIAPLAGADSALTYVVEPLRGAGQLHEVDGVFRLTNTSDRHGDSITLVPTPGHTPGHQSVVVEGSNGQQIVITGDVVVHAVQIADPDVGYLYEQDRDRASQTRRMLLEAAQRDHALLATAHLTQPFVGTW